MLKLQVTSPLNYIQINSSIYLSLNYTDVLSGIVTIPPNNVDVITYPFQFNSTNTLTGLKIDQYGLIHSITYGNVDYITNNKLFTLTDDYNNYISITGNNNFNIKGNVNQINTSVTNNTVTLKLDDTNVNKQNIYTFNLKIVGNQVSYYNNNNPSGSNSITLVKGKLYTFNQSDVDFIPISNDLKYINLVNNNIPVIDNVIINYFINGSLKPLTYLQYNTLFHNRLLGSTPYFTFFIPTNAASNVYTLNLTSMLSITPLTINYDLINTITRYNNINSIGIDNTGRIYDVENLYNNTNMISFNVLDNNNTSTTITNNTNFNIIGNKNNIITKLSNTSNNYTLEIDLVPTDIITNNINLYYKIKIINENNQIYAIDENIQNSTLILIIGYTYIFDQSDYNNPLLVSANPSSITNIYTQGITYYYNNTQTSDYNVYINNITNATNCYISINTINFTPIDLYLFFYNQNLNRLHLQFINTTKTYSNIKSLTIDNYGRINSINSDNIITSSMVTFTLTLYGYNLNTFTTTYQSYYISALCYLFIVQISNNDFNIELSSNNNNYSVNVNTKINNLTDFNANSIAASIRNLYMYS